MDGKMNKKSFTEKFSGWYIPLICRNKFKALAFYLVLAADGRIVGL